MTPWIASCLVIFNVTVSSCSPKAKVVTCTIWATTLPLASSLSALVLYQGVRLRRGMRTLSSLNWHFVTYLEIQYIVCLVPLAS